MVTDHIYHPLRGTLKQIKSRNAAGRTVQSHLYVYDALGNMQRRRKGDSILFSCIERILSLEKKGQYIFSCIEHVLSLREAGVSPCIAEYSR